VSYPFGGHPRFNDYLEWARTDQGCTYQSGYSRIDGKIETMVRIDNPANGKHVFYFAKIEEYLLPSAVAHLDRRLGLSSPFPKMTEYD
jgi:hypothetical protein